MCAAFYNNYTPVRQRGKTTENKLPSRIFETKKCTDRKKFLIVCKVKALAHQQYYSDQRAGLLQNNNKVLKKLLAVCELYFRVPTC
jgi:hypothetical protein